MNKMDKLKTLKDILKAYDDNVASNEGATAYESDRLIQGMRYILNQPDDIDLDIVKPSASEVQQMIDDTITKLEEKMNVRARLHHTNYHGNGGGHSF